MRDAVQMVCYVLVVLMTAMVVYAIGARLESQSLELIVLQDKVRSVERAVTNDSQAIRLLWSLKRMGVDVKTMVPETGK